MPRRPPADDAPPWKKPRPKDLPKRKLTQEQVAEARARAAAAGRPYPNFIDNAAVARAARTKKSR
ncbi:MAG TPA: hypothetical protein VNT81_21565 [Vicinamibacterales bacterium]|nr:hypothetical protein [Vicinamibacterales bacterium]